MPMEGVPPDLTWGRTQWRQRAFNSDYSPSFLDYYSHLGLPRRRKEGDLEVLLMTAILGYIPVTVTP